ncbi:unnamed protein product [Diplocarpon coronariae]
MLLFYNALMLLCSYAVTPFRLAHSGTKKEHQGRSTGTSSRLRQSGNSEFRPPPPTHAPALPRPFLRPPPSSSKGKVLPLGDGGGGAGSGQGWDLS